LQAGNLNWGRLAVAGATGAIGGFAGAGMKGFLEAMILGGLSSGINNGYQQLDDPCEKFDKELLAKSVAIGAGVGVMGSVGQHIFSKVNKVGGSGMIENTMYKVNTYNSTGNYANHGAAIGGAVGSGVANTYGN